MDEELLSDADLWDLKVRQGMPKAQATDYVRNRSRGAGGTWEEGPKMASPRSILGQIDQIRQGMSLGLSDEAAALVQSIPSLFPGGETPREAYRRNLAEERAPMQEYAAQHPGGATAMQLMGAAATGRALPKLGGALAEGIIYGGIAGAGMADDGERLKGGAVGAATGGVLGPIAARAIPALGKLGSYVADVVPGVRNRIAPALQSAKAPGAQVRMTGGGMADDAPVLTASQRATEKIVQAAQRAGVTTDDIAARVAATEKPVTVMEAIGQPARRLGRAVNTVPSEGSQQMGATLASRMAGQEDRIIADLVGSTGLERRSAIASVREIAERRSQQAAQNYAPVYEQTVDATDLRQFFDRPAFQRAYNIARDIAANEGQTLPPLSELNGPIPVKTLDLIKRGMDDMIHLGKRSPLDAGGVGPASERAIRDLKNNFLSVLDDKVEGYAAARSAFAGETALMDAMEEGRRLFNTNPEDARLLLQDLGESEVEAWRRGALDAVAELIESVNTSHDVTARRPLADSTLNQRRLLLLFPDDEAFRQFQEAIKQEAEMAITNRFVTGGSNTADKLADLADLAGVDLSEILQSAANRGIVGSIIDRAARSEAARIASGNTEALADALAPQLTAGATNRADLQTLLQQIREVEARMAQRAAAQQGVRRGVTGLSGGLLE